jgi:hypothetical protein
MKALGAGPGSDVRNERLDQHLGGISQYTGGSLESVDFRLFAVQCPA